jgi:hypothetical protein
MASSGQAKGDDFPLLLAVRPIEDNADFERSGLADANIITKAIEYLSDDVERTYIAVRELASLLEEQIQYAHLRVQTPFY